MKNSPPLADSASLPSRHLPHINGLRAVAILGILFYHLRETYCPAGYFGVDLFLVISGFLLFRSLLRPESAQQFHYGSYLQKKAWRIFPSWFIVTLVVLGISVALLASDRWLNIWKTALYSCAFVSDYYIDLSGDYFNIYSQQNPFLHFWYLSVTQQLYIVAPLLIIPLVRWCSRRVALLLLLFIGTLSLAYYILTTSMALIPESLRTTLLDSLGCKSAYYHLIPRFWEVAAGALILLLPELKGKHALRFLLGCAGLAGIISSFWLYETGSALIYLTVLSSILAIRYADSGMVARILNFKPFQALGTISFSVYLWHWPVMVFWKYCCMDKPGPWSEVGMLTLSLLLGFIGWFCVERLRTPSLKGWCGLLLRCSIIVLPIMTAAGASKVTEALQAKPARKPLVTVEYPENETDAAVLKGLEKLRSLKLGKKPLRVGSADARPQFMLIGDSHAGHIYDALHQACQHAGIRGVFLNNSVCPFWNFIQPPNGKDSCLWNKQIAQTLVNYLKLHPEIHHVLIAQSWELRLSRDPGVDWRTGKKIKAGDERRAATARGLEELCKQLHVIGVETILLGDTPYFPKPSPRDEWERCKKIPFFYQERYYTQEEHCKKNACSHALFKKLATADYVHYIDLAQGLMFNGVYPARLDGEFLYQDCDHLEAKGEELVVRHIMPRLLELLNNPPATASPQP